MTDREKLVSLALCLKAIDDAYEELADFKATVKASVETLLKESHALRYEILSGQEQLPLEPTPPVDRPGLGLIDVLLQKVADQVNSGALNTPGVKCSATVGPAAEASAEERARTRRRKPKMQGQDAILPDNRPKPDTRPGEPGPA